MLKLLSTLPNLANLCSRKSIVYKIYPICKSDDDFCEELREDMTDELTNVFNRKAVVDETFIRNSSIICKSIVGVDSSQLHSYSTCQI